MKWLIYKHTNKINGKVYIGQTRQNPKYRWGQYGQKYNEDNIKLYRAIQKYGWDNFDHEIIEDNIFTQEEADLREQYWINFYDSYYNGYNATKGGHDGEYVGIPIYKIDINTLQIVTKYQSASEAGRLLNKEHCSSISTYLFGKQISAYGFYWCKVDEWFPGWYPRSLKNTRPVLQINKETLRVIKEFSSLKSAEKEFKSKNIANCCRRKSIEACGYYWCYSSDYSDDWVPEENKHRKRVIQMDDSLTLLNVFDSIREAAKATNTSENSISRCCSYKAIKANNSYWCYECDYCSFTPIIPKENHTNAKTVCQIDKNTLQCINKFPSVLVAAKETGCSKDSIGRCCRKEDVIETGGFYWCYEQDLSTFKPKQRKTRQECYTEEVRKKIGIKNSKKVQCIENGLIFTKEQDACAYAHVSVGRVGSSIKKKQAAGGYHWKYVE